MGLDIMGLDILGRTRLSSGLGLGSYHPPSCQHRDVFQEVKSWDKNYSLCVQDQFSRDQFSQDQLPPDQLSLDQLAMKLTSHEINSTFIELKKRNMQHVLNQFDILWHLDSCIVPSSLKTPASWPYLMPDLVDDCVQCTWHQHAHQQMYFLLCT